MKTLRFLVLLLLFFLFVPNSVLASTYGTGNYGSGNYNQAGNTNSIQDNKDGSATSNRNDGSSNYNQAGNTNSSSGESFSQNEAKSTEATNSIQDNKDGNATSNRNRNFIFGIITLLLGLCIFLYLTIRKARRKIIR